MVAASKLKKNQSAMNEYKAYAKAYGDAVKNISTNTILYSHPFFKGYEALNNAKNASNTGIIIISTDRGLCGSFNLNLFKLFLETIHSKELNLNISGHKIQLYITGKKGLDFFKKSAYDIAFGMSYYEEGSPDRLSAILSDNISNDFVENKMKEVYIISNSYVSTMQQKAAAEKILPIGSDNAGANKKSGGYLIEPAEYEQEIIDKIFKDYIKTKIYFKILESFAGEQAARMIAMDNATRNAGRLINKLTVSYNKARQAAVTLEILDIINGANAIK